MPNILTADKEKLKISACTVDDVGNISVVSGKDFTVKLNPSSYSHAYGINYSENKSLGKSGSDTKFSGVKPEEIKFSMVVDGTGVAVLQQSDLKSVKKQLQELKAIVYTYDGEKHEPNYVRVLWGSQIFFGRLSSMAVQNTLFKPSGEPLRAKLDLAFTGFMSKEEEALRANKSSPDMSHLIEVKAGDTLPLLCYRVYKDSSYYMEVAMVNNITNFRDIKPGQKLHFPPLSH